MTRLFDKEYHFSQISAITVPTTIIHNTWKIVDTNHVAHNAQSMDQRTYLQQMKYIMDERFGQMSQLIETVLFVKESPFGGKKTTTKTHNSLLPYFRLSYKIKKNKQ